MGSYKECIILSFLIGIHELGHCLAAKTFSIPVKKIIIYPLGGISIFDMDININKIKEFWILIMGPLFQTLAYLLLNLIIKDKTLIKMYHFGILSFNLLPIYPLDGGRILNLFINHLLPYKKSFKLSILISYIITILVLFSNTHFNINMIITYVLLITIIRKEQLKLSFYFYKFLLERLLKKYYFKKNTIVYKLDDYYKYKNNYIKQGKNIYSEKEYLVKKYEIITKKH